MTKAATLVERLVRRGLGCCAGMHEVLRWASDKPGSKWARLSRIEWDQDLASAGAWFNALAANGKLPASIRGLWFTVPEIGINEPILFVGGFTSFRPGKDLEWATDPVWPDHQDLLFQMDALAVAKRALGLGDDYSSQKASDEALALYVLPLAYTAFLVGGVCRGLVIDANRIPKRGVGVAAGFAGGDYVPIGTITRTGFQRPK